MDRIERHDLINAIGLAAVLMTLALFLLLSARALFGTVGDGLVDTRTVSEPTDTTLAPAPTPADDGSSPPEGQAPVDTVPPVEGATTTVPGPAPAARPPAEVTVRIGNSAQRAGVAAAGSDRLEALGYQVVDIANGPALAASVVYFAPGYEAEARAVAAAVGVPDGAVRPVPADPELDATGVSVLVLLGADTTLG